MAVVLWKNGSFKICNEHSFLHELDAGWSLDREGSEIPPAEAKGEATQNDIIASIQLLEEGNTEHWTSTGKPMVAAIETILGKSITSAQRDAAIEAMG